MKPRYQALGHQWTNLLWREVNDCHYQFSNEFIWLVERSNLGAGLLDAKLITEIYMQNIGGLPSLIKHRCAYDPSNSEVYIQEVVKCDGFHVLS